MLPVSTTSPTAEASASNPAQSVFESQVVYHGACANWQMRLDLKSSGSRFESESSDQNNICVRGETGSRTAFRRHILRDCGFDSHRTYHTLLAQPGQSIPLRTEVPGVQISQSVPQCSLAYNDLKEFAHWPSRSDSLLVLTINKTRVYGLEVLTDARCTCNAEVSDRYRTGPPICSCRLIEKDCGFSRRGTRFDSGWEYQRSMV